MVLGSGSHLTPQVLVANPWVDRFGDFQVPPTGWLKSPGSVPSLWYSAIDNYIASNGGSISSTSQQHRAEPKARTEGWAMFREDHVRNLVASSKDTAFVRALVCTCVRPSVSTCDSRRPVSCGYAYAPSGEVLGHRSNVAKLNYGQ